MTALFATFVSLLALLTAAYVFMNASSASIAKSLRLVVPALMIVTGGLMTFAGRGGFGIPLLVAGTMLLIKNRQVASPKPRQQTSTVRSAWLEMHLDHASGDLDGVVLTGKLEGARLSDIDGETLLGLYADLSGDRESAALLEAYLDRRAPGWRETAHANGDTRAGEPPHSGPMTKEEAYQVLGLDPGSATKEIVAAHRRLMKAVHPDSGGSTFLAARINEAKDTLLG